MPPPLLPFPGANNTLYTNLLYLSPASFPEGHIPLHQLTFPWEKYVLLQFTLPTLGLTLVYTLPWDPYYKGFQYYMRSLDICKHSLGQTPYTLI